LDNDRIDEGCTLLYTLWLSTSAQSLLPPSGHPIVVDHADKTVSRPSPVSLLGCFSRTMGPGPSILILLTEVANVAQTLLPPHSGNKPGCVKPDIARSEINTGGERWVSNPR